MKGKTLTKLRSEATAVYRPKRFVSSPSTNYWAGYWTASDSNFHWTCEPFKLSCIGCGGQEIQQHH